jgi:ABC-type antimicrobial peptide transport system permease subunit
VAGETILLIICGVYSSIGYYRHGIWDNRTKPGMKSYFAYSFTTVFILNLPIPLVRYFKFGASVPDCLYSFARNFIILFPLGFAAVVILGVLTKRKQKKLAEQYADDEK